MAALATGSAAAFAAGAVPATGALLKAKLAEKDALWEENLDNWLATRAVDGGSPRAEQSLRRTADAWAVRQGLQVGGRKLTREKTARLAEAGIVALAADRLAEASPKTDAEEAAEYALPRTAAWTALAALCGALAALAACAQPNPAAAALTWLGGWAMAIALMCDARARLLPLQCCAAVGLLGLAAQLAGSGPTVLPGCLGAFAVAALACWIVNRAFAVLARYAAVGAGDARMMAALGLATSMPGAAAGFAASAAVQAAVALAQAARGRLSGGGARGALKAYVPMAPGLAAWWVVGITAQAAFAAGAWTI